VVLVCLLILASDASGKPIAKIVAGRRAVIIDERLSVLRERPDIASELVQRLRRGRLVGIMHEVRGKDGHRFFRVVVTRRTSGWILADALARSGSEADAQRLLELIGGEREGFAKVRLATICVAEFGKTRLAPRAYLLLAESAEAVAKELTRAASRRLNTPAQRSSLFMLNDVGLDRYTRIGVRFRFNGESFIYDGHAYRELLRRYPRSDEAVLARTRLAK
jgi:hypothetical protein